VSNSERSASVYESKLIGARLWAADETLGLLLACHPHAASLVALVRSDLEAVRMILSWREDEPAALAVVRSERG
jgi:hypothetical protein